ncbi:MAG TPA: DCC1-like thiol-disulfide oxidoreductase family protein [Alphaproteobacteria bacterium]|nr:DCC1-like thiol-disulfide oxidoreductase family protein [Alphaproteobacteria bacterium]
MTGDKKEKIVLVYDHDCPVCRGYCTRVAAKNGVELELLDARQDSALMDRITEAGLDIDEGMVLLEGDTLHYGSDAGWRLARYTQKKGVIGFIDRCFFATRGLSRVMYPVGKAVRNALLWLLRIPRIENLKRRKSGD